MWFLQWQKFGGVLDADDEKLQVNDHIVKGNPDHDKAMYVHSSSMMKPLS